MLRKRGRNRKRRDSRRSLRRSRERNQTSRRCRLSKMMQTTAEMLQQIDARAAHLEKVDADVREWEKKTSKSAETELKSRAAKIANELAQSHADKNFCIAEVPDADGKLLQGVAEALKSKINGPIFLVGTRDASVALVAYVPKQLTDEVSGEQIDSANRADCWRQRRRSPGERPRRREGYEQDRGGACESAGASELEKPAHVATALRAVSDVRAIKNRETVHRPVATESQGALAVGVRACFTSSFGFLPSSDIR